MSQLRFVIFGLSVSSSWGNGHATLWRGLLRGLARDGHRAVFFEKDQPFYRQHRDLFELPDGNRLRLYDSFESIAAEAEREIANADVAIVTSYCPDSRVASDRVRASKAPCRLFYDLDTPVTIDRHRAGLDVAYLPDRAFSGFDLVLSYTGGEALSALRAELGAERVAPLYGSVDPDVHQPFESLPEYRADVSHLGTYSADRQHSLSMLFLQPADRMPDRRFMLGGSMYPQDFPWRSNLSYVTHVPPEAHPAFYGSSPLTVNVTRAPFAALGFCPSGRLFEAAACGVPVLSDSWAGLEQFYQPEEEILIARSVDEALAAIARTPDELARIGRRARQRTLDQHTGLHRARELVSLCENATRKSDSHRVAATFDDGTTREVAAMGETV